jgi:hypothetical protein
MIRGLYVRALDPASKHLLLSTRDPLEQAWIVYASLAPRAWHCLRSRRPCVFDRYAYSLAYQLLHGGVSEVPGADPREVTRWYNALLDTHPPRMLYTIDPREGDPHTLAARLAHTILHPPTLGGSHGNTQPSTPHRTHGDTHTRQHLATG